MSGQDILPELQAKSVSRTRRRVVIFVLLVSVIYFILWRGWENLRPDLDDRLDLGSAMRGNMEIVKPPEDLLKLVENKRETPYPPNYYLLKVSAIIVLSSYDDLPKGNIQLVLRSIMRHPFVREVIVWSDDAMGTGADLKREDLLSGLDSFGYMPEIRIINSPGGMREMSYHMACSLARFETCYFNDPNILNLNLNTLYTKYIELDSENKSTVANQALPEDYLAELPYEIHQSANHLRASVVSRLSRGSLVPKKLSIRFFHQLSTASLPEPMSNRYKPGISRYIAQDLQFSAWLNRQQLKLISSPQSLVTITDQQKITIDPSVIQYAIQRLNDTIQSYDPFLVPEIFPRPLSIPEKKSEDEVGVVSASDDQSMLITNFGFSKDWPLIVDGSLSTCWKGSIVSKKGKSYFGLNFVNSIQLQQITLIGEFQPEDWDLEFFLPGDSTWTPSDLTPIVLPSLGEDNQKYSYEVSNQSFMVKKIRFKSISEKTRANDEAKAGEEDERKIKICGWLVNKDWII